MSKQSNQRYRKEKEKEHLKTTDLNNTVSGSADSRQNQDKINREFDNTSNKADR